MWKTWHKFEIHSQTDMINDAQNEHSYAAMEPETIDLTSPPAKTSPQKKSCKNKENRENH